MGSGTQVIGCSDSGYGLGSPATCGRDGGPGHRLLRKCLAVKGMCGVTIRGSRVGTRDLRLSTEDLPKLGMHRIDPDFLERAGLTMVLFQFTPALGLSEPDPISRPVGGAGKAWNFHEALQQQRLVSVTQAPVGSEWFKDP